MGGTHRYELLLHLIDFVVLERIFEVAVVKEVEMRNVSIFGQLVRLDEQADEAVGLQTLDYLAEHSCSQETGLPVAVVDLCLWLIVNATSLAKHVSLLLTRVVLLHGSQYDDAAFLQAIKLNLLNRVVLKVERNQGKHLKLAQTLHDFDDI